MTPHELHPCVNHFLGITQETIGLQYCDNTIGGNSHDRIITIGEPQDNCGNTIRIGLDVIGNGRNVEVNEDIVHGVFSGFMNERGVAVELVGGFSLYRDKRRVSSASLLSWDIDKESFRIQRTVIVVANSLILALSDRRSSSSSRLKTITNHGLLLSDKDANGLGYEQSHLLLSHVVNGVNGITSSTIQGAMYQMTGRNVLNMFHDFTKNKGLKIKQILQNKYPYSGLLPIAERIGMI